MTAPVRIGTLTLGERPLVVAAGGEAELDALCATTDADLIELRADLFTQPTPAVVRAALTRLRGAGRPILLTVRSAAEGGRALPDPERLALYEAGLPLADAVDVETASTPILPSVFAAARAAGKTRIASFHDFSGTPPLETLRAAAERGIATGAEVVKLVTTARDLLDVQVLLELTLALRPHPVATMAMGAVGAVSRVFFPAAGSLLTYGCVGAPTAPGQLLVSELAALVRRFFPPTA